MENKNTYRGIKAAAGMTQREVSRGTDVAIILCKDGTITTRVVGKGNYLGGHPYHPEYRATIYATRPMTMREIAQALDEHISKWCL